MFLPPARMTVALLLGLSVAACNQTAAPPSPAAPGITPTSFRMPEGSGCAGEIGRFRAVAENDVRIGHLNRAVHERLSAEIDRAAASCSAGRDAEAVRMVAAVKSRYGYR
jgi:hypothetical protein